jgi:hypothetical protein
VKVCPTCQQTYADEGLNFCLNDGAVLVKKDASAPPETVFINQPPPTNSDRLSTPTAPANWGMNAGAVSQPTPKSRAWLWVLGIIGAVILLCGGGFVGLVALVANNDNKNKNLSNTNFQIYNTRNGNTYTPPDPKNALTDDLSKWVMADTSLGLTDYQNGELSMTSKTGGYYFVLLSAKKDFQTENATTRVTVRNTTGGVSQGGYGLMVHNNPSTALAQDYAFLINSATSSYRIIKHQARKETEIVKWTYNAAVKNGTQTNVLQVRDNNGSMTLYVNDKPITTIEDKDGIKSGVPGLYASGAIPIAFSNLQVEK